MEQRGAPPSRGDPHTGFDVVMMRHAEGIECIVTDEGNIPYDLLTPNDKRYELREITGEPEHPESLTTAEDYENAPKGTIVARNGYPPYVKIRMDAWADTFNAVHYGDELDGTSRKVLRWGWDA